MTADRNLARDEMGFACRACVGNPYGRAERTWCCCVVFCGNTGYCTGAKEDAS